MKSVKLLLPLTVMLFILTSCKKGEDDPLLSLRTRKARATGEWNLSRGSVYLEERISGIVNASMSYTFTEDSYAYFNSSNGDAISGNFKMTLSLSKDGDMAFSQSFNSDLFQGSGTWDFEAGIGESKNKEILSFKMASTTGESYFIDLFNKSSTFFNYKIRELRNEKLVIETEAELIHKLDDSASYYVTSIYTFVQ